MTIGEPNQFNSLGGTAEAMKQYAAHYSRQALENLLRQDIHQQERELSRLAELQKKKYENDLMLLGLKRSLEPKKKIFNPVTEHREIDLK